MMKTLFIQKSEMPTVDFPLQPWQDRVIQERNDLQMRWQKLTDYKREDRFADLDMHDRRLLLKQWMVMSAYLEVLNERITRFKSELVTK